MNGLLKLSAAVLTTLIAGAPALAGAACVGGDDMHALEAAALQQRLMVAALSCRDTASYNRFVIGHRSELQKSDAALMAYFKRTTGGVAAYHSYKTHLANQAALDNARSDDFCGRADQLFARLSDGGSLGSILDNTPVDTGYAACAGVRTARAEQTPVDAGPPRRHDAVRPRDYADDASQGYPAEDRPTAQANSYRDESRGADPEDYGPPPPRDGRYAYDPRGNADNRDEFGPPPPSDDPYAYDHRRREVDDRDDNDDGYGQPPRDDRYDHRGNGPDDRDDEADDLPFWAR